MQSISHRCLLTTLLMLGLAAFPFLNAQKSSAPGPANSTANEPATLTLHANSRLVLLDIVVTGRDDQPVRGLKGSDFSVLEDGKPQSITAWEEHDSSRQAPPAPPIQLPTHQYTNFPVAASSGPINIVLLDTLNSDPLEQHYARKQMIEFLQSLPNGKRIALFALGTRLRMIQGFTGNSEALIAAAKSLLASKSPLVTTEADRQTEEAIITTLAANAGPSLPSNAGAVGGASGMLGGVEQHLRQAFSDGVKSQENQRVELTLQGLAVLAGAVSGYPGRKNLLWLSTNFPFRFGPDLPADNQSTENPGNTPTLTDRTQNPRDFEKSLFQSVAALLAGAQVAVYPIDIGGLASGGVNGVEISTPATPSAPLPDMRLRSVLNRWDTHEAMTDIARETGGEALYGANDFKNMMQRSIQRGENYYTLAYVPANRDWNGKYRKLQVKISRREVNLEYRRGYYGLAETALSSDQRLQLLAYAMQPSVPEYTMLLLKVQVLPPDREHKEVRIDYAVAPSDITFIDAADRLKHARVDFIVSAWGSDNKLAAHASMQIDFHLRLEKYEEALRTGIPAHQELDLKPGKYTLRLGVMDRASQKLGTVDVPLTIGETVGGS
jgi:VWFA-related protein